MTRTGINGEVMGSGERLTLEEAIYNATMGTAYMTFDEATRGTLAKGKVADMIVLPEDVFTMDPEKLRTIGPLETIIAGKTVWRSDGKVAASTLRLEDLADSCFAEEIAEIRRVAISKG